MTNFSPRIEESTDKQLLDWIDMSDTGHASLASDELTRRSLNNLKKTTIELDKSNKKYSQVIGLFAIIQIAIAVLQLLISIRDSSDKFFSFFIGTLLIAMLFMFMRISDKIFKK